MKKSLWMKIKPPFVRLALEIMPYIPLPYEWYRKFLVKDSENRYATGRWAYLQEAVYESHRYNAIIGCCDYFSRKDRKVLDVGCGEGVLQKRLSYSSYAGIDMNEKAIHAAKIRIERERERETEFVLASANEYEPHDTYDVLVFNESLYYIKNPLDVLKKFRASLAKEGIIIVCMFPTYLARKIWNAIDETDLAELTSAHISSEAGYSCELRVYANPGQINKFAHCQQEN